MKLSEAMGALLGVSAYQPPDNYTGLQIDDQIVKDVRRALGGQLQPLVQTRLRWYMADLERAQEEADAGNLKTAAQLYRAMRRDGVLAGLLRNRSSSLIRLPKRFYGSEEAAQYLRSKNGTRPVFDEVFPPSELRALDEDGLAIGVGVAELVPVPGRDYPVMVRLDPEFLQYIWTENRWYFASNAGRLAITPGDGRWILHIPGARMSPWNFGHWAALGRSFINKEHALSYRSNYSAKLANPARMAYAPAGATEVQRKGFIARLMAWGLNTVFELPPGWEAKLLESNGRGYEVFQKQIDTSDLEYMITLTGQTVTTTGGMGFSNADVPETIRQDLIQDDGDALSYTINTQGLPMVLVKRFGDQAIEKPTILEWNTEKPADRAKEAATLGQVAAAIKALGESLAPYEKRLNVQELTTRFAIPVDGDPESVAQAGANEETAPVEVPDLPTANDDGGSEPAAAAAE